MALLYLHTSALVKIYVNEPGSQLMRQLVLPSESHEVAIAGITPVELHSAIRRRQRGGNFSVDVANRMIERFNVHLTSSFLLALVADREFALAIRLIARHYLRGYDAVQLAACLTLADSSSDEPVFVCSDSRLLQAAQAEGLTTLDPAG